MNRDRIEDVSKSYNRGKVKAVDGLTLTVNPGEFLAFSDRTAPAKRQRLR